MSRRLPSGNLPVELSSFVGRRKELTDIRRLLSASRLVTLAGVGGVGKTRLALRVADEVSRAFGDGAWLVELAGLQDPVLLARTVSHALGVSDQSARDQVDVLTGFLRDRQALLVVDNCEHLLPASALLIRDLLRAAPGLRVLATSRERLSVPGERVYPVLPLAVPANERFDTAGAGVRYPALELFRDRAAAVVPGFTVTRDNVRLVAQVCHRLDGIPLAIELAASRLYTTPLEQVAADLEHRFDLLDGGNRAALPRQRTLRAAVEWSYDLCAKTERLLWVRASVFAAAFSAEAAVQVCGGDGLTGPAVAEALAGLVNKSVLIEGDPGEVVRFRMLDTLREYGLARLRDPDEADVANGVAAVGETVLRRRHRDFCVALAERFAADWFGPRQPEWTRRMSAGVPNLRAALGFCLHGGGGPRVGLRIAGALYYFWYGCGEIREGRHWLERLLAADLYPGRERMRALAAYGRLLILQGEPAAAVRAAGECLPLARQFDEPFAVSHALQTLGLGVMYLGDPETATRHLEEAVAVAAQLGPDDPAVAFTTFALAVQVLLVEDDPARSADLFARSIGICRAHGDLWWLGNVLTGSIIPALRLGDVARATAYGQEALRSRYALDDRQGTASTVEFLAWAASAGGDHVRAARLLGATDRHWRAVGGSPFGAGPWRREHDRYEEATRQALGAAGYEAQFRRGSGLTLDEATAYAVGDQAGSRGRVAGAGPGGPRLTRREREVADLVAQGLSNRRIAELLTISQRTAETHVENILAKFGFTARAQIAAWFREQGGGGAAPDDPPAGSGGGPTSSPRDTPPPAAT